RQASRAQPDVPLMVRRERLLRLRKLLLEGRFPPKSVIPVDVDPVQEPGVFRFGAAQPLEG
ncbi:MAG: hypothetical protein EOO29_46360, partial [Comamonadaceae bacterium]